MGIVISIVSAWDRNQWRFARLWSRDYDDLVAWIDTTPTGSATHTNEYAFWKNSADGKGKFAKILPNLQVAMYCDPAGLHFIDMNGMRPHGSPHQTFQKEVDSLLLWSFHLYSRLQLSR